ncbi:hypothetical protein M404DRAFT_673623 [Pisolithus tinctorius Marx 270]|uniref:Uncharacterized protein n=1 Tax=Pisolithus tinctorius Marx 270 TaxID=870435 RepID=A0A0C3PET9_PISTI|nr:hypothetical protein M404DRAFT_673623 [Pisolithus tinctorius Marx 270]
MYAAFYPSLPAHPCLLSLIMCLTLPSIRVRYPSALASSSMASSSTGQTELPLSMYCVWFHCADLLDLTPYRLV